MGSFLAAGRPVARAGGPQVACSSGTASGLGSPGSNGRVGEAGAAARWGAVQETGHREGVLWLPPIHHGFLLFVSSGNNTVHMMVNSAPA